MYRCLNVRLWYEYTTVHNEILPGHQQKEILGEVPEIYVECGLEFDVIDDDM